MQAALKKLRAGDEIPEEDRDKLLKALKKAVKDLKQEKKKRSEMIVRSCEQAGLHNLPESGGVLDDILSKGSHKNLVRTVAYDPSANGGKGGLQTCVSYKTYKAAMDFIDNGGIDRFKRSQTNLMSLLVDFNDAWNKTDKLMGPFVVGNAYDKPDFVDAQGNETKDPKKAVNRCETSETEEQCSSKRASLRDEPGSGCLWMPNFDHLEPEIHKWYNDKLGNKGGQRVYEKMREKKCVKRNEFHLPLRKATVTDVLAQHSNQQVDFDDNMWMDHRNTHDGETSTMQGLKRDKSLGKNIGNKDYEPYLRANFNLDTKLGTPTMVPYTKEWRRSNKRPTLVKDKSRTYLPEQWDDFHNTISRLRRTGLEKNFPPRIKGKIDRILEKNRDIVNRERAKLMLADRNISASELERKVREACLEDSTYVSAEDVDAYVLYQLARAGRGSKVKKITESDIRQLYSDSLLRQAGDVLVCTNDANAKQAWVNTLKKAGLESGEQNALADKIMNIRSKLDDKTRGLTTIQYKRTTLNEEEKKDAGANIKHRPMRLDKFLIGGGDDRPMVPVELPPANSKAAENMFVTFNHEPINVWGPLEGGADEEEKDRTDLRGVGFLAPTFLDNEETSKNLSKVDRTDVTVTKAFEDHVEQHISSEQSVRTTGFVDSTPDDTMDCKAILRVPGWILALLKGDPQLGKVIHKVLRDKVKDDHKGRVLDERSTEEWWEVTNNEFKWIMLLSKMPEHDDNDAANSYKKLVDTEIFKKLNRSDSAHVLWSIFDGTKDDASSGTGITRKSADMYGKLEPFREFLGMRATAEALKKAQEKAKDITDGGNFDGETLYGLTGGKVYSDKMYVKVATASTKHNTLGLVHRDTQIARKGNGNSYGGWERLRKYTPPTYGLFGGSAKTGTVEGNLPAVGDLLHWVDPSGWIGYSQFPKDPWKFTVASDTDKAAANKAGTPPNPTLLTDPVTHEIWKPISAEKAAQILLFLPTRDQHVKLWTDPVTSKVNMSKSHGAVNFPAKFAAKATLDDMASTSSEALGSQHSLLSYLFGKSITIDEAKRLSRWADELGGGRNVKRHRIAAVFTEAEPTGSNFDWDQTDNTKATKFPNCNFTWLFRGNAAVDNLCRLHGSANKEFRELLKKEEDTVVFDLNKTSNFKDYFKDIKKIAQIVDRRAITTIKALDPLNAIAWKFQPRGKDLAEGMDCSALVKKMREVRSIASASSTGDKSSTPSEPESDDSGGESDESGGDESGGDESGTGAGSGDGSGTETPGGGEEETLETPSPLVTPIKERQTDTDFRLLRGGAMSPDEKAAFESAVTNGNRNERLYNEKCDEFDQFVEKIKPRVLKSEKLNKEFEAAAEAIQKALK